MTGLSIAPPRTRTTLPPPGPGVPRGDAASPGPSPLEWVAVVTGLFLSTAAVFPLFFGDGLEPDVTLRQGDTVAPRIWLVVYAVVLLHSTAIARDVWHAVRANPAIMAACALALASTAWSAVPRLTLEWAVTMTASTLFGLYVGARFGLRRILTATAVVTLAVLLASVVVAVQQPLYGLDAARDDAWRGVFTTKNELGRLMAIGLALWGVRLVAHQGRRWITAPISAAFVVVMVLSEARTAIVIASLLPVVVFWDALLRRRGEQWQAVKGLAFVICIGLAIVGVRLYDAALSRLGAEPDLTGRTEIWAASVTEALRQPFLGYGAAAFWRGEEGPSVRVWRAVDYPAIHSHNGFLDLFLVLGVAGLVAVAWSLVVFWRRALAAGRLGAGSEQLFPLVFLMFFVGYNITESSLVSQNGFAWIVFVAVSEGLRRAGPGALRGSVAA